MEKIENVKFMPGCIKISLDVVTLYINILLYLDSKIIRKHSELVSENFYLSQSEFLKTINFPSNAVFDKKFYKQIKGCPKGSNIFFFSG